MSLVFRHSAADAVQNTDKRFLSAVVLRKVAEGLRFDCGQRALNRINGKVV